MYVSIISVLTHSHTHLWLVLICLVMQQEVCEASPAAFFQWPSPLLRSTDRSFTPTHHSYYSPKHEGMVDEMLAYHQVQNMSPDWWRSSTLTSPHCYLEACVGCKRSDVCFLWILWLPLLTAFQSGQRDLVSCYSHRAQVSLVWDNKIEGEPH